MPLVEGMGTVCYRKEGETRGAERQSPLRKLGRKEGRRLLERQARRLLGMSADEFARKWKRGEFPDPDQPEIMQVAMLLPFGG